jgi:hypothetical protein
MLVTSKVKNNKEHKRPHLKLLKEAIRGLQDVSAGKTLSLRKLKARYCR